MTTQRIVGFDDPTFDSEKAFAEKIGTDVIENPYPKFAEMRAQAPVHAGDFRAMFGLPRDSTLADMPHWTVVAHREVMEVLGDQATYGNKIYERNLGKGFGRSITTMDPPEHPRYRKLFQKAFTPVAIANWGDTLVKPVIEGLVEGFVGEGKAELVRHFTTRFPFHFIYSQLDLPEEDRDTFHKLAVALTCIANYPKEGAEASRKLGDYMALLLRERRGGKGTDLITLVANAEIDGGRLPEEVMVGFFRQLMNAAADTTYRGSSNLLAGLLANPEQLEAVRQDRKLIPQVIEEGLRWETPVVSLQRCTTKAVTLGGVELPEGAALDVVIGSANRDERQFQDPERFDIQRKGQRQVAFGFGPHVCIGQHLARVEITVALNALLDKLPNLRLDPDKSVPVVRGLALRAADAIHVRWD